MDVSVLMPFRNAEATIVEAVMSVLSQRSVSLELVAVDDGSTDRGAARLATLARSDSRIQLISGTGDGIAAALELGRRHCTAPLIARMDSDDICLPNRLVIQRDAMNREQALGVVGAEVIGFPESAIGTGLALYVQWQNGLHTPREHVRDLFVEAPLCHPSVMVRASALTQVGGWRSFDGPEDYDLWLRLHAAGWQMAKVPEVLLRWRHLPGRATFSDPRCHLSRFRAVKAPHLAAHLLETKRPICIWGAGQTGKRLARELEPYGVLPARFVDIDPKKVGRPARQTRIDSADSVSRDEYVVVAVGARGARALIREQLAAHGFVELDDFVCAA